MYCKEDKEKGRWYCVADGPADPVTGKRKQIKRTAKTRKEAKSRVEEALKDITEHGLVYKQKDQSMVFDKFAKEWIATYSTGVKKGTVRVRGKEIKILNRYIAKVTIDKVTRKMYQNILNDLHSQEYAVSTIEGVHVTANMIFKQAVLWQIIKSNPCEGAKIPKRLLTVQEIESGELIDDKYLEQHELKELLQAANKYGLNNDKPMVYLFSFSGLRVGELCASKWTDLDFATNYFSVTKTLYNPNNNMYEYELETPKTEGSIRKFDLIQLVMDVLKDHKKSQAKVIMKNRLDYHDENFIFAHENGYPIIPKNVNYRLARLVKKTSIKKHVTSHTLRHTHISMLAEAGVDLKTVMERVGHTDSRTTIEIYTHVTNKMKERAAQKYEEHVKDLISGL